MRNIALLLVCMSVLCACGTGAPAVTSNADTMVVEPTDEVTATIQLPEFKSLQIHSISQLNSREYPLDSAAGEENKSKLVANFRESYTLDPTDMGGVNAYYTRIKKIDESNYIMIYHNNKHGGSVFCMRSNDMLEWNNPVTVFKQTKITVKGVSDNLKYMTPDACVLDDGRIIAVTSFRAEKAYEKEIGENGVAVSYSSDMGKTWTKPQVVYVGTNWEPSVLQADNGEIYIYFTCTAPSILLSDFAHRSSGVGMIRSNDNGKTWTPNVTGAPYIPQYVMRCFIEILDGVKKYNDQMPVAVQLNNGTIALAVETYKRSTEALKFSISYNNDGYKEDIGMDATGPANRQTNLFNLAGPYIRQFPSGEVVLTYHWSSSFRYRLANCTATEFYDEVKHWTETGMWGSSEIISSHSIALTICTDEYSAKVGRLYLNHRINANRLTPTLTANTTEWDNNTDAVFLGANSQAQISVRIAHDDDYIYFLGERLDNYITDKDKAVVYIHDGKAGNYQMTLTNDSIAVEYRKSVSSDSEELDADALGIKYNVAIDGIVNDILSDFDNGIVYEIAFPKSLIEIRDNELNYRIKLINRDTEKGKTVSEDSNPKAGLKDTNDWSKADLK